MDSTTTARNDSSSEDELHPMDVALDALKHLKLGFSKLECAACMYETEYAPWDDPYNTRVHPFRQQFKNTYEGMGEFDFPYFFLFIKISDPQS